MTLACSWARKACPTWCVAVRQDKVQELGLGFAIGKHRGGDLTMQLGA